MPEMQHIYSLLEQALADTQKGNAAGSAFSPDLRIGGRGGALDSLDTMMFLDRVEELLEEWKGRPVALVTDEAFMREGNPFHSMSALAAYIRELTSDEPTC